MHQTTTHTAKLQHWLEQMESGDEQARIRLIEHAGDRLKLLARRMLGGFPMVRRWEETDDVFNESLTRLYRSLESVQPESPRHFYSLAATQIRRVLIDMSRRYYGPLGVGANHDTAANQEKRREPSPIETAAVSDQPTDLMEWTEFHEHVESLPDQEREVFNLLWYEGLSQDEAAQILGVSERTLRRRWQDARYRLSKVRLGEHLPD